MKVDFNKPLIDLEDKPIEDFNIGKNLATLLAQNTKGDCIKLTDWARQIYKGEVIDLDNADQITMKEFIKSAEISNILKSQLLECLIKNEK